MFVTTLLLALFGLFSLNALALPYQIEAGVIASQSTNEFEVFNAPTQKQEADGLGATATYYLLPVNFNRGPLAERAFFDKAAFVNVSYVQSSLEDSANTELDTFGFNSRFVLVSDHLFEVGYSTADGGSSSDITTTEFSIGKYLGNNATVILNYTHVDNGPTEQTLVGEFRNVSRGESDQTWTSSTISLGAIDVDDSTGFVFSYAGNYYPTERLSLGLVFGYTRVDNSDSNSYGLSGRYFLSPSVFTGLSYARSDSGSSDLDLILLDFGIRF